MNVIARLWRWLFARPEKPSAPPLATDTNPGIPWGYITRGIDDHRIPRGEYRLPEPLPGVRPAVLPTEDTGLVLAYDGSSKETLAQDSISAPLAWGFGDSGAIGPGVAFLGFPYLAELAQITEYRTPAETLSTEMTRRWVKLTNKGSNESTGEKIKKIEQRLEELCIRDLFREAALKCEQFGRAHLAINVKDGQDDKTRQLPLTEIGKGELEGFVVIEPYWMTPYSWNSTEPRLPDFYKPQSWFELGKKTHSSRYCTFIFREVPDLLKPAYDFAGISITQLMMPYVNRWLRTAKSVNDLINIFSMVNLATDLATMLKVPESDPKSLTSRLKAFVIGRDNKGIMTTNKDTEDLSMQNVPLGTLDKLQAQAQEHMATPGRMPLIKFFGITPTGLNATSEGEFQNWYAYVKGMQELGFSPNFAIVLNLVQQDLYGTIDKDIGFEWQPLFEPTGKELAEIRKSDSERDGVYVDKGVIDPEEIRTKLKKDPDSGYNNLTGPAPDPVMEVEAGLEEEAAQAGHERSEESAENAHARKEQSAEVAHERNKELDVDTSGE